MIATILIVSSIILLIFGIVIFFVPWGVCNVNGDCPLSQVCSQGKCLGCMTSSDCTDPNAKICFNNSCVQCRSNSDCPPGQRCNSFVCSNG